METTCPVVGDDEAVDVEPSLTSAYCNPEDVVMNCKSGATAGAALAIVVGADMRMVDAADAIAAT